MSQPNPTPQWQPKLDIFNQTWEKNPNGCSCKACNPNWAGMTLCGSCGCKRCPHATHHDHTCTQSNAAEQDGSVFGDMSPEAVERAKAKPPVVPDAAPESVKQVDGSTVVNVAAVLAENEALRARVATLQGQVVDVNRRFFDASQKWDAEEEQLRGQIEDLDLKLAKAQRSLTFTVDSNAATYQRLHDFFRDKTNDLSEESRQTYFNIVANGIGTMTENPTYHQVLSCKNHEIASLKKAGNVAITAALMAASLSRWKTMMMKYLKDAPRDEKREYLSADCDSLLCEVVKCFRPEIWEKMREMPIAKHIDMVREIIGGYSHDAEPGMTSEEAAALRAENTQLKARLDATEGPIALSKPPSVQTVGRVVSCGRKSIEIRDELAS
jgi:hypothetical protein